MQGDDRKWAFITGSLFIQCFCLIFLTCSTLNAHVIKYPSEGSAEVCYSELVSDSLTVGASAEEAPPEVELSQQDFEQASDFPNQDEPEDGFGKPDDFTEDAGDLTIGESEDLTVMEIIVYYVIPLGLPILFILLFFSHLSLIGSD